MFLISRASLKKHNLLWLHRRGLPAAFLFTLTSIYALVAEEPERLGCCSLLRHLRGSYILPLNIRMQSFLTIDLMYCSGVSILHSCGCNYICLSVVGLLHEGYERPDHALQCPMSAISADCSRHGMKHLSPPLGHSVLSRISRSHEKVSSPCSLLAQSFCIRPEYDTQAPFSFFERPDKWEAWEAWAHDSMQIIGIFLQT